MFTESVDSGQAKEWLRIDRHEVPRVGSLLLALLLASPAAIAQDALRLSLSSQSAAAQRHLDLENMPYTTRWGDLKLLTSASFAGEFNDNVNLVNSNPQQDIILQPMGKVDFFWPVTE